MSKEERVINYYVICNKLKNIIRTGWIDWKVNKEAVADITFYPTARIDKHKASDYLKDLLYFRI